MFTPEELEAIRAADREIARSERSEKREYMRNYMRGYMPKYIRSHPEYAKRLKEHHARWQRENKEKWNAYQSEYKRTRYHKKQKG
jgi:hypothetical protein